jgi:hypothetical protein
MPFLGTAEDTEVITRHTTCNACRANDWCSLQRDSPRGRKKKAIVMKSYATESEAAEDVCPTFNFRIRTYGKYTGRLAQIMVFDQY